MENYLGPVNGKLSRLRKRVLKSNGITTRHYALDRNQHTTHQNSELATLAVADCLRKSPVNKTAVDLLAVATTQGDLQLPGMASIVQALLQLPPCEIFTAHGVCSSSLMALKSAANQVRLGQRENAIVCASELASRLLKRSRYEALGDYQLDFECEFLRWMLSDGAGALLVQPRPRRNALSLRIDWIEIVSFASDYELCMSCGTADQNKWTVAALAGQQNAKAMPLLNGAISWQDYPTYAQAEAAGALLIRQNLQILPAIVQLGVEGFIRLINAGKISADQIDHFVCHYSSHYFRNEILSLSKILGCYIPEEKWFTNLYTKGNTGCAALFIALEELLLSSRIKAGETIFCVVPESGRFCTAYAKLTAVGG